VFGPDDLDAGAREIDRLILADKRARSGRYNRQRGAQILGPIAIGLSIAGLAGPALIRAVDPATSWPLPTLAPLAALTVLVIGIALVWHALRWDYQVPDQLLPATVAQWLAANGHEHGVRYWDEIYWPEAKRYACRREVLGFIFWTKLPPPASKWPKLRIHNDPERDYWEHGAGRPVSERYRRAFMARIERWNDLAYRLNWTGWALVATRPRVVVPRYMSPTASTSAPAASNRSAIRTAFFGVFCRKPSTPLAPTYSSSVD